MLDLPERAYYLPVPLCGMLSFEVLKGLLEWLCDQLTLKAQPASTIEPVHSVLFSLAAESECFVGHWLKADFEPPALLFHHSGLGWFSSSSSALTNPEKTIPGFGTSPVPHHLYHSPLGRKRELASWLLISFQPLVSSCPLVRRVSLGTVSAV